MPSTRPLPTIQDLRQAAADALVGERDFYADKRTGAIYDHIAGPMAILWSREAQRDQDLFNDIYEANATSDALTRLMQQRYNIPRILDTYGQGQAVFSRPTNAGGGGKLLRGTRIQVAQTPPIVYQIATDTSVGASALAVPVPIQATVIGTGNAVSTAAGLSLLDPTYDATWTVSQLTCADGTNYESAATYRARVATTNLNARNGYLPQMVIVCQNAGARFVLGFPSTYGLLATDFTSDHGLNAIYVSDQNFSSSTALIQACAQALESARVLGADLWIGGVAVTPITTAALVTLVDDPAKLPVVAIRRSCTQALLSYFGATSAGFFFKAIEMGAVMARSSPYVQTASFTRQWTATTAYTAGALVVPPVVVPPNCGVYQCTTPGISGSVSPTFPNVPGATAVDNTITWTCTQNPFLGIYNKQTAAQILVDPTITPQAFPGTVPRYTLAPRDIQVSFTGPI